MSGGEIWEASRLSDSSVAILSSSEGEFSHVTNDSGVAIIKASDVDQQPRRRIGARSAQVPGNGVVEEVQTLREQGPDRPITIAR